jgi:hypothetical protein
LINGEAVSSSYLSYAKSAGRRAPRYAACLGLVLGVTILLAGLASAPTMQTRLAVLRFQQQCEAYTAADGEVAFESWPPTADLLLSGANGGLRRDSAFAVRPNASWNNLRAYLHLPVTGPQANIFLHRLRTPSGKWRLVAVDVESFPQLRVTVIEPGDLFHAPAVLKTAVEPAKYSWVDDRLGEALLYKGAARYLAGQIDRDDPTHFLLPLVVRYHKVQVDGWLRDDDTVPIVFSASDIRNAGLRGP